MRDVYPVYSQPINILGPLTYTTNLGTTLYGVVSGSGTQGGDSDCNKNVLVGRVSEPNILNWIKDHLVQGESIETQS